MAWKTAEDLGILGYRYPQSIKYTPNPIEQSTTLGSGAKVHDGALGKSLYDMLPQEELGEFSAKSADRVAEYEAEQKKANWKKIAKDVGVGALVGYMLANPDKGALYGSAAEAWNNAKLRQQQEDAARAAAEEEQRRYEIALQYKAEQDRLAQSNNERDFGLKAWKTNDDSAQSWSKLELDKNRWSGQMGLEQAKFAEQQKLNEAKNTDAQFERALKKQSLNETSRHNRESENISKQRMYQSSRGASESAGNWDGAEDYETWLCSEPRENLTKSQRTERVNTLYTTLSGMSASYKSKEDYMASLEKHKQTIIREIGVDNYNKLYDRAAGDPDSQFGRRFKTQDARGYKHGPMTELFKNLGYNQ